MSERIGWILEDPVTSEVRILPTNPHSDSGSNAIIKSVAYQTSMSNYRDSSGVDRTFGTVVFSGSSDLERFAYSGNIYTKDEKDAWEDWCSREYPVYLTDDLKRRWLVMFDNFEPSRVKSRKYPWKHSYVLSGIILAEVA